MAPSQRAATPTMSLLRQLHGKVDAAGLLAPRDLPFFIVLTLVVPLFLLSLVLAFLAKEMWQLVLLGIMAAFFQTQIELLGHDVDHGQAPKRVKWLRKPLSYLLGNALVALSKSWWNDKHTRHHQEPNRLGSDPDIDHPIFLFDPLQADKKNSFQMSLVKIQHILFPFLIFLQALSFRRASVVYAMTKTKGAGRVLELSILLLHVAGYVFLLYYMGMSNGLLFGVVHQGLLGAYNSLVFAPNHKDMPIVGADTQIDSLTHQVITSRNVNGGWAMSLLMGGLDFQIEHHAFPYMPRWNLRKAKPIVKAFCLENGIPYTESSPFTSYARVMGSFRKNALWSRSKTT